jgi:putative SOS response-associated peptidase YedK
MCGRYSFAPNTQAILDLFAGMELPAELEMSFNIAPTQQGYIITNNAPNQLSRFSWGLVPQFAKSGIPDGRHMNARAETVFSNQIFQEPVLRRRCLVLADSFYEWKHITNVQKQPYRILRKDGNLLALAGLWNQFYEQGKLVSSSFTILTTTPNAEMGAVHDRMPVILNDPDQCSTWLSDYSDAKKLEGLLQPLPDHSLRLYAIGNQIGKYSVNHAGLHEPVPVQLNLFDL